MRKTNLKLSLFLLAILSVSNILYAGTTLIEDNRVTNLGYTPVLGRGYSVATNTYQSTCLKDIQTTEPSYDLTYSFQEMDKFLSEINSSSSQFMKIANVSFKNSLSQRGGRSSYGSSLNLSAGSNQSSQATSTTSSTKQTKEIVVSVSIDSYYASVDESSTHLADTAANLITNNDILGFFSSCGPYYIRSIRRNAQYLSVFKYEVDSSGDDGSFEYQLETELKGFRKQIYKDRSVNYNDSLSVEASNSSTDKNSFSNRASSKNLTITASAFGLGKNEKASLISYDIEGFKTAIRDAFISMQNPRTGKVTSIEVVPWVENTEFQTVMKLEQNEERYTVGSQGEKPVVQPGSSIPMYEKKQNLNQNAEFLAELDRADRAMLNVYYKAKICQKHIDSNWKQTQGDNRVLKDIFIDRWVMNNFQTNAGVKLAQLDAALTTEKIKGLLQNHRDYTYGNTEWGEGAAACRSKLMELGIHRINHRNIGACAKLEENLMAMEEDIIENHCMPVLFEAGFVPSDTTAQPR
ncbi:hypothetical protein KKA14_11660 [bacterium]|nr:hypothetical protein [bacterium]